MPTQLPPSTALPAAADPAFDRIARLVRDVLGVPTALVTLVSQLEQVFPGAVGLPEPWQSTRSTPLSHSFCQHVLTTGEPLVVTDARTRPELADNLAITDLHVVAYAGMPLVTADGVVLGSLCAIDDEPREWTGPALATLADLAATCSSELQLRLERATAEAQRHRLELAIEASSVGTFDWDLVAGTMDWDAPLIAAFGYTEADFSPTPDSFYRRLHPADADRVGAAVQAAIDGGQRFAAEYRVALPDGSTRWVQGRGRVLTDAHGRATRFVGAAYDTTDVHSGDAHANRLLTAMPSGFLSLDREWRFTVLNPAAEALLGRTSQELVGRTIWEVFPDTVGGEFERGYRAAVDSGVPQTVHAHYPPPLDAWFDVLCWPSPDGLSLFFSDVSDRARADQRAEDTAGRLALLARVADALVNATDVPQVLTTVPELLVPLVADACVVTVLGADGRARDVADHHDDPARRTAWKGYVASRLLDLGASTPFAQALRTGLVQHVSPAHIAAVRLHPEARAHLDALGPARAVIVPLRASGEVVGALTLISAADRPEDAAMDLVVTDIADRLGVALHADRLSRARTQLAEDLQRSLLTDPPEPDHAEIVVRYVPAVESARVGGDWYDAFLQPDGCTMLVIGDVAGHDTAAAATMGQLRGLLRGIATYSSAGPAEVLRGLDTAMRVLEIDTLATVVVARFEQTPEEVERGTTRMLWASAGHPPPLVVDPDDGVHAAPPTKGDLLLGVDPEVRRTEHVTELRRGATVLLFTDGLVERPGSDLDAGYAELAAAVSDLSGEPLDGLADGVVDRLVHGRPTDDVALVAIRLHRQDRPRPAEAGPQRIPPGVPEPEHPAQ